MTCFWDAILRGLPLELFHSYKPDVNNFIYFLKNNNKETLNVQILPFNIFLTKQRLEENIEWIKNLNILKINQGYNCSSVDPFLCLISELFKINIIHTFYGEKIIYNNILQKNGTLYLNSQNGHCNFENFLK